jgi:hypothetical protein
VPWSDPYWVEGGDNAWCRGLRWQQGWWRETVLGQPPGHIDRRDKAVVSMLPVGVGLEPNLMTPEARTSAQETLSGLRSSGRPGLIDEDRLQRNLLSSQPLCFNLFGHLTAHREALLPWVKTLAPEADAVTAVELEWAPAHGTLGGSAFDAFIEYERHDGCRGFLGVECKYAENLKKSQRNPAADKYLAATVPPRWRPGAVAALDRHGRRQLWYNQLLAQIVAASDQYCEGVSVVVACSADMAAREAVATVSGQLSTQAQLRFCAIEDVLDSVPGHNRWKSQFRSRYIDFSPIQELLAKADPRRQPLSH